MNAFQLSDEYVEAMAACWPVMATFQGVPGHDAEWTDYGPEGVARAVATLHDLERRARALAPPADRWEALARDFMLDTSERHLLFYGTDDHLADLNAMDSPSQHLRMVFDVMDMDGGREAVRRRLESIDVPLASYRRLLERGVERGVTAARRQVSRVIEQCRVNAGQGSYFSALEGGELRAGAEKARAEYGRLADWLESEYLPHARTRDAVGLERYQREVRRFLGATIDLEETYDWGWHEIRRIHDEMVRVAREIDGRASLAAVLETMKNDPSRACGTQAEFVDFIRERQGRAYAELQGRHFDVPSEVVEVTVQLAPPGGPLGAYYIPPSEDFSRPGSIWYSLGETVPVPVWDQVSTAYHEGFPGHHLQCGLQVSLRERLGRLQRLEGYSGYAEGWALYTERLMDELGYYEKPDYKLGMLACQMMRACRVVVDIGSHLDLPIPTDALYGAGEAWTFERAVRMLVELAGMPPDHADSEVTRYLGWPAQAIAYKVGERLILELRDEYRRAVGDGFVLKDFHNRVLACGNVALERLRAIVLAS
jgi:uncharacterized protein (DUF885 family)